jgi:hypothetical protein
MTLMVAGASISAVCVLEALTTTISDRPAALSVIGIGALPAAALTLWVTCANPTRLTVSS